MGRMTRRRNSGDSSSLILVLAAAAGAYYYFTKIAPTSAAAPIGQSLNTAPSPISAPPQELVQAPVPPPQAIPVAQAPPTPVYVPPSTIIQTPAPVYSPAPISPYAGLPPSAMPLTGGPDPTVQTFYGSTQPQATPATVESFPNITQPQQAPDVTGNTWRVTDPYWTPPGNPVTYHSSYTGPTKQEIHDYLASLGWNTPASTWLNYLNVFAGTPFTGGTPGNPLTNPAWITFDQFWPIASAMLDHAGISGLSGLGSMRSWAV